MKKKLSLIMALAMIVAMVVIPTNAEDATAKVLNCGEYIPTIDGVIDDAYYKSCSINHVWPEEKTSSNYWGNGIWFFGEDGVTTAYDWEKAPEATSYFLWEEAAGTNFLYVAVDVVDNTGVFEIPEEKLQQALDKGVLDYGLWLLDGVCPYFGIMIDTIYSCKTRVDAGGNFGRLDGIEGIIDWKLWCKGHEENYDEGLWEVAYKYGDEVDENGDPVKTGYTVEFMWPMTDVASGIFTEGGEFYYGLQMVDSPIDPAYGWDQGELENGNYVEGFNPDDFMTFLDLGAGPASAYGEPSYVLTITEETVTLGGDDTTVGGGDDTTVEGGDETTDGGEDVPAVVGDINGDGEVTAKDLTRLMKYIAGAEVEVNTPDLNEDGEVTTKDLTRLMKIIAGAEI